MSTRTDLLAAVNGVVRQIFGPGNTDIAKRLTDGIEPHMQLVTSQPQQLPPEIEAVIEESRQHPELGLPRPRHNELAKTILGSFRPRKTGGGYTAYANDKTMAEWRDTLGG
jgi:hypothetical protein